MRAREFKGSISVWQALDLEYSRGMGFVFTELSTALVIAENEAHARWERERPPR